MNFKTLNLFDCFNTPILVTDGKKNVCFKNRAAKKNIPSPRLNSNIEKYINNNSVVFENNRSIRIETIKKSHFYRRAIVISDDEYDIWIFCTGLQYYMPDENFFADKVDIGRLVGILENSVCEETGDNGIVRYGRLCEYLGKIVSAMDIGENSEPYNIVRLTKIIRDFTESALSKHNRRFAFENFVSPASDTMSVDLLGFVNLYINMLSIILRLAAPREISVKIFTRDKRVCVEFIGFARIPVKNTECRGIPKIYELYPAELLNCSFIGKFAELHGADIDFSIIDKRIILKFEMSMKQDGQLHSPKFNIEPQKEIADSFMSALSEIIL